MTLREVTRTVIKLVEDASGCSVVVSEDASVKTLVASRIARVFPVAHYVRVVGHGMRKKVACPFCEFVPFMNSFYESLGVLYPVIVRGNPAPIFPRFKSMAVW